MDLFFIGNEFYNKSGSAMSSIYTTDYVRSDWGKVQMALARGEIVRIKPGTKKQMMWANEMLGRHMLK